MTDVTDLQGVGPTRSERMADAGYDSVEAIAEADPEELAEAADVTEDTALGFVVEAENAIAEETANVETSPSVTEEVAEAVAETDDAEDEEVEAETTESEEEVEVAEEPEPEGPEMLELDFTFETALQFDCFHDAMMEHRKTMIRGNRSDYEVFTDVLDAMRAQGPDGIEVEVEKKALNEVHNATRKMIVEYQGESLIDHMDALKAMLGQIDEHREKYLF